MTTRSKSTKSLEPPQIPSLRTEELWHAPHIAQRSSKPNDRRRACTALPHQETVYTHSIREHLKLLVQRGIPKTSSKGTKNKNHTSREIVKVWKLPILWTLYKNMPSLAPIRAHSLCVLEPSDPHKAEMQGAPAVASSMSHHQCFCSALHLSRPADSHLHNSNNSTLQLLKMIEVWILTQQFLAESETCFHCFHWFYVAVLWSASCEMRAWIGQAPMTQEIQEATRWMGVAT